MKKLLLFCFVVISLSGCWTEKKINRFKDIYCIDTKDSVYIEKLVKIPVYYSDSSGIEMWLRCDSIGEVLIYQKNTLQGKYTTLKDSLKNNKLTIYGRVYIRDTIIKTDTIIRTKESAVIEKTTNVIKGWQYFFLYSGGLLWLILLIYSLYRLAMFFINKYSLFKK